ncbi:HD domain-containing protein [Synechococcus sp. UW140]|uniref:HD domain-containing protein n=1 Tax=Synechococcus sp. UW140 TaxID=368503 RepID=UPI0025E7B260|nr:HD domain-containing protein [Synechococcus sp. UW140]
MARRTYHDPLHGEIVLDSAIPAEAMAMALIESAPFQRLRRIRQLGPAFLTFHGAESSRFTHSLGVLQLARRALKHLERLTPELEQYRALLYGAALLHDVGHAPLSHSGEEMFGLHHETWSARLILEQQSLRAPLDSCVAGNAEAVAQLLEKGIAPHPAIAALVSSQLDCDRLDYIRRDSYSTGTAYGQLDLSRLIGALVIAPDGQLAIHPRGRTAVEHYLVVRSLMYGSVYNHRINIVCNWLLQQIIVQARRLSPAEIFADSIMSKWLWHIDSINSEEYIANDDLRTGYHLMRWREEGPAPLQELCQRLLERRLLQATDVRHLTNADRLGALALAQRLATKSGLNPEICCGLRERRSTGYRPYVGGLRLWDGEHLQALEQVSPLVNSLSHPQELAWVLHPREVRAEFRRQLPAVNHLP